MQHRNRHKQTILLIALLAFALAGGWIVSSPAEAAEKSADHKMMMEIAGGMVCLCGCGNQILATCTCGEASSHRDYILSLVKMGKTREEIKNAMIKKQGTQVLAAPDKKGLNWVLWVVVPYILPIVAMIMVAYLLIAWAGKKRKVTEDSATTPEEDAEHDKYLQKIKEELDEFS